LLVRIDWLDGSGGLFVFFITSSKNAAPDLAVGIQNISYSKTFCNYQN
jgi:hypothetical protein